MPEDLRWRIVSKCRLNELDYSLNPKIKLKLNVVLTLVNLVLSLSVCYIRKREENHGFFLMRENYILFGSPALGQAE